jgi:hypothetical protein
MDRIQSFFLQEKGPIKPFILTWRTHLFAFSLVRVRLFKDLDNLLARIVHTLAAIGYSFVLCADSHVVISTRFHTGAAAASYLLCARIFIAPPNPHPKVPHLFQMMNVSAFCCDITGTQTAVVATESYYFHIFVRRITPRLTGEQLRSRSLKYANPPLGLRVCLNRWSGVG